jgi:CRISPR/Cas system-associated exonuclease Cas4 (RecB family)
MNSESARRSQDSGICLDAERNISLGRENFPLTENDGYCRFCQFRELCDRAEEITV